MTREDSNVREWSKELFRALREKGFPEDFCREIAYKRSWRCKEWQINWN